MSDVRKMIEAIALDDFDGARDALKITLADYMAGRTYVSNSDLFGEDYTDDYKNPNVEDDLRMQAAISGGKLRDHDKTGDREEEEETEDYVDDVVAKKKNIKHHLRKGGIHTGEDLEESVKVDAMTDEDFVDDNLDRIVDFIEEFNDKYHNESSKSRSKVDKGVLTKIEKEAKTYYTDNYSNRKNLDTNDYIEYILDTLTTQDKVSILTGLGMGR